MSLYLLLKEKDTSTIEGGDILSLQATEEEVFHASQRYVPQWGLSNSLVFQVVNALRKECLKNELVHVMGRDIVCITELGNTTAQVLSKHPLARPLLLRSCPTLFSSLNDGSDEPPAKKAKTSKKKKEEETEIVLDPVIQADIHNSRPLVFKLDVEEMEMEREHHLVRQPLVTLPFGFDPLEWTLMLIIDTREKDKLNNQDVIVREYMTSYRFNSY